MILLVLYCLSVCVSVTVTAVNPKPWGKKYDYIVVGGGTAGCVLAARLSDSPDVSVLLLEAGPLDSDDPFVSVPRTYLSVIRSGSNQVYQIEPQEYLDGKKFSIKVGKMLGGSSSHNGMTIARASKQDFAKITSSGINGWSYDEVLPFYKKYENVLNDDLASSDFRGTGGPVSIQYGHSFPLTELFIDSGKELGWNVTDYFGDQTETGTVAGFGYSQINVDKRGHRSGTGEAYIRPIMGRWNLEVVTEAVVQKVFIKGKNARGVWFTKDGQLYSAKRKKEIILSAGAFASAQLLMLSGIGPKSQLKNHKINFVKDLPVGQVIKDRLLLKIPFTNMGVKISQSTQTFEELFNYLFVGKSAWTSVGNLVLGTFRTSSITDEDNMGPNLMMFVRYAQPSLAKPLGEMIRNGEPYQNSQLFQEYKQSQDGPEKFWIWIFHFSPRTSGNITLTTSNINDNPTYKYDILKDTKDIDDVLEGINIIRPLLKSQTLENAGIDIQHDSSPECSAFPADSDEYWKCFIKLKAEPAQQPFGSCKMGSDNDPYAIVDSELRVKGVKNLRVADASIIPMDISGNPMLQVIMIAEKAADMIKKR